MIKIYRILKVLVAISLVFSCTTESSPSPNVPFRSADELARLDELREFGWQDYGLYWDSYGGEADTLPYWFNLEIVDGEFYAFGELYPEDMQLGRDAWFTRIMKGNNKGEFVHLRPPFDGYVRTIKGFKDSILVVGTESSTIYFYEGNKNVWDSIQVPFPEQCDELNYHYSDHFSEHNDSLYFYYTACNKYNVGSLVPGVDSSIVFERFGDLKPEDVSGGDGFNGKRLHDAVPEVIGINYRGVNYKENDIIKKYPIAISATGRTVITEDVEYYKGDVYAFGSGYIHKLVNGNWERMNTEYVDPVHEHAGQDYFPQGARLRVTGGRLYALGVGLWRLNEAGTEWTELLATSTTGERFGLAPWIVTPQCWEKGEIFDVIERNDTLFTLFVGGLYYMPTDEVIECSLDYKTPAICDSLFRAHTCSPVDVCIERREHWENKDCASIQDTKNWWLAKDPWGDLDERVNWNYETCNDPGIYNCPAVEDLSFPDD